MRCFLSSVLSLALILSVSAAGYGYAAGANHCWMMALHGHHMQAAAHCARKAPAADRNRHAGMSMSHSGVDMAAPGSSTAISAVTTGCQCCLGPATLSVAPTADFSLAGMLAPLALKVLPSEWTSEAKTETGACSQRAPPSVLLTVV